MASPEQVLLEFYIENSPVQPFNWLQGRSFSEAFVICIGAGPWKFGRRKKIQGEALEKLGGRDISQLPKTEACKFYPLDWQNKFLYNSVCFINNYNISFEIFCKDLYNKENVFFALNSIYSLAGAKGNPKVLSLFCRDGLQLPSFPIDRHVKRKLTELKLPTEEFDMISLCNSVGINPRDAAVAFVRAASDMDNPDWSI